MKHVGGRVPARARLSAEQSRGRLCRPSLLVPWHPTREALVRSQHAHGTDQGEEQPRLPELVTPSVPFSRC